MRRAIALIGAAIALSIIYSSIGDFDKSQNGFQLFKAIFWMVVGGVALAGFVSDFKNNKWPL